MNKSQKRRLHHWQMAQALKNEATRKQFAKAVMDRFHPDEVEKVLGQAAAIEAVMKSKLKKVAANIPNGRSGFTFIGPRIQEKVDWIITGIMSGDVQTCGHLGKTPQPVFLELWRNVLHCGCQVQEARTSGMAEDFTCDICRITHEDDCRAQVVQMGPMTVSFGICSDCAATELRPMT